MKQRHVLAPVMAAALAALGAGAAQAQYDPTWQREVAAKDTAPLTREQVRQELASARAGGWQGYGSEETLAPPEENAPRSRAREEVVAELSEWRQARAIENFAPEGSEAQVHERRMALHKQQVQRYAAAQRAEQERLAREREAEAQRLAAQTAVQPAEPGGAAPVMGGSGTSDPAAAAPVDSAGAAPAADTATTPAQPEPTVPPVSGAPDAAVDSTRGRSSTSDSLSATPQPVPEPAPSDARPLDTAPGAAPSDGAPLPGSGAAAGATDATAAPAPVGASTAPASTEAATASPSAVPSPVTESAPATPATGQLPPAAADAPAAPR